MSPYRTAMVIGSLFAIGFGTASCATLQRYGPVASPEALLGEFGKTLDQVRGDLPPLGRQTEPAPAPAPRANVDTPGMAASADTGSAPAAEPSASRPSGGGDGAARAPGTAPHAAVSHRETTELPTASAATPDQAREETANPSSGENSGENSGESSGESSDQNSDQAQDLTQNLTSDLAADSDASTDMGRTDKTTEDPAGVATEPSTEVADTLTATGAPSESSNLSGPESQTIGPSAADGDDTTAANPLSDPTATSAPTAGPPAPTVITVTDFAALVEHRLAKPVAQLQARHRRHPPAPDAPVDLAVTHFSVDTFGPASVIVAIRWRYVRPASVFDGYITQIWRYSGERWDLTANQDGLTQHVFDP